MDRKKINKDIDVIRGICFKMRNDLAKISKQDVAFAGLQKNIAIDTENIMKILGDIRYEINK